MLIPNDCFHGTEVPEIMRDLTPEEVIGLMNYPSSHGLWVITQNSFVQAGARLFNREGYVMENWEASFFFWSGVLDWRRNVKDILAIRADACVRYSRLEWPEAWELAEQRATEEGRSC